MTELYNRTPETPSEKDIHPLHSHPVKAGGGVGGVPPCLFSNNSTERAENPHPCSVENKPVKLASRHKKQAHTLGSNVHRLVTIESKSINHVAFLTLTFKENLTDHKEVYDRFRSFNSHFLAPHPVYGHWISVKEHQARGAWHFHMIIQLSEDIRTGFDFDEYDTWLKGPRKKGTFPTGNNTLRSLWHELGEALPGYGFGQIFTLEPIKSNAEAIRYYVGKYVSKQIGQRPEADKGVRLINYSKGWLKDSMNMAWFNENSTLWREKVAIFARMNGCQELYQLSEKLGSDWAYKHTQEIVDIPIIFKLLHKYHPCSENVFVSPTAAKIEAKSEARLRADWNQFAIENFDWVDQERKKAVAQKVAVTAADRARKRKIQKSKIKVQLDLPRAKNPPPGLLDEIKKEVALERLEYPTRQAKNHKDRLARIIQAGVNLENTPTDTPF